MPIGPRRTILLVGIATLVMPGPAFLVIPLGLSIPAIEFAWAKRWLGRVTAELSKARQRVSRSARGRGTAPRDGDT